MLFTHDASYYAQQIRTQSCSIISLVEAAIQNIKNQNPILNAVTSLQEDYAINLAKQYDQQIHSLSEDDISNLPPFFGVPILLKDLGQNQAGFPSTSGSKLFQDYISQQTDHFVNKIIESGFIIIGRTNIPEFGFKNISDAQVHGLVNSPLDLGRNPGGSSGGAAAALKTGWLPITTASDGGGSIRIPASFSGLIGLKPSRGRMPVGPNGYRSWQGSSVNFALTKSIRDTWTLLKAMQVEQREAPFSLPIIKQEELTLPERPLKIAYSFKTLFKQYEMPQEVQDQVQETIEILKSLGHILIEDQPQIDGQAVMESYYTINGGVETAAMMKDIETSLHRPLQAEDMEPMSWLTYQYGLNIPSYQVSQTLNYWDQLTVIMEDFYQTYDMWLTPATNGPAPIHGQFNLSSDFIDRLIHSEKEPISQQKELMWDMFDQSLAWTPYTQLMNLTGQPAISLPITHYPDQLPLGMQFAAGKGNEYLLLQLGLQLEQAGHLHTEICPLS